MLSIQEYLQIVGNFVTGTTQRVLEYISDIGIITSPATAKLISILLFVIIAYLGVSFIASMKKALGWGISIVSVLIIISIIST